MTIKINLSKILGEHRITQKALSDATGIRPGTISLMYNNELQRLERKHMDKICAALSCCPGDLFEYVPPSDPLIKPLIRKN